MALSTPTLIGTQIEQAAAAGTNSTATVTSASATWAADDLCVCCWQMSSNAVSAWNYASLTASGGAIGTPVNNSSNWTLDSGGYKVRTGITVVKVTTGFTGTFTWSRTAGSADHWTTVGFYKVTGQDLTTPIAQSAQGTVSPSAGNLSINFGSTPNSTSLAMGAVIVNGSQTFTPPTGWTETAERTEAGWGANVENAYDLASAAQNNTWGLASASRAIGLIVEIAEAGGGGGSTYVRPTIVVPRYAPQRAASW